VAAQHDAHFVDLDWNADLDADLVAATSDGSVVAWDVGAGALAEERTVRAQRRLQKHRGAPLVTRVARSTPWGNGMLLAVDDDPDVSLKLIELYAMRDVQNVVPGRQYIRDFAVSSESDSNPCALRVLTLTKAATVTEHTISSSAVPVYVDHRFTDVEMPHWYWQKLSNGPEKNAGRRVHAGNLYRESLSPAKGSSESFDGLPASPRPADGIFSYSVGSEHSFSEYMMNRRLSAKSRDGLSLSTTPNTFQPYLPFRSESKETNISSRRGGICFSRTGQIVYFFSGTDRMVRLDSGTAQSAGQTKSSVADEDMTKLRQDSVGSINPFDKWSLGGELQLAGDEYLFHDLDLLRVSDPADDEASALWSDVNAVSESLEVFERVAVVIVNPPPLSLFRPSLYCLYELLVNWTPTDAQAVDRVRDACNSNARRASDMRQPEVQRVWNTCQLATQFPDFVRNVAAKSLIVNVVTCLRHSGTGNEELAACICCVFAGLHSSLGSPPELEGQNLDAAASLALFPAASTEEAYKREVVRPGLRVR